MLLPLQKYGVPMGDLEKRTRAPAHGSLARAGFTLHSATSWPSGLAKLVSICEYAFSLVLFVAYSKYCACLLRASP